MGDHAGEGENTIFQRKMEDIAKHSPNVLAAPFLQGEA
jgi:hypothetical protein